jgi:AAA domain
LRVRKRCLFAREREAGGPWEAWQIAHLKDGRSPTIRYAAGVTTHVPRRAEGLVKVALSDTRIVVVNGARQVGKSTLIRAVTRGDDTVAERRLDRTADREAARRDPERFVAHDGLLVIDEVQRAP